MANQIFKFPGFFDREFDLTPTEIQPQGVPAGVVGAAQRGPAFVPYTIGSFADFEQRFGGLDSNLAAPYAVDKFLDSRTALTFVRVLGGGANTTAAEIETTRTQGTVTNAGFYVSGTQVANGAVGAVQFLVARHYVSSSEAYGFPVFTNNDTYFTTGSLDEVYLVRGTIFTANDTRVQILSHDENYSTVTDDYATANSADGTFKMVISSSAGGTFGNAEGFAGVRILTASMDPSRDDYFANLLNTDPTRFEQEKVFVYADYAVDDGVASVATGSNDIMIASGSANTSANSGDTSLDFLHMYGKFDTRYKTPTTTWFISQPYGSTEYDLFRIESIDDGEFANSKIKISISNLLKSSNPRNEYGTFSLQVRDFEDTDAEPRILEQFNNVTLDPSSDNFIGKVIGDKKAYFNFDVENEDDRRIVVTGKYANRSKYIRVILNPELETGTSIPTNALPFGFRGVPTLNTNPDLVDAVPGAAGNIRLAASGSGDPRLIGAVVPPVPFRFKVTRGEIDTTPGNLIGSPGNTEIVDERYYWGVKFGRTDNVLNPNTSVRLNSLIPSLTKFQGIKELDAVLTGSKLDDFNENKFSLARVALANGSVADVTSSVNVHMRESAYIRNGEPDVTNYTITDGATSRITMATLFHKGSTAAVFNRFSSFTKFTTVLYGGFDGNNILDKNAYYMNDRATSGESRGTTYGGTNASFVSPGFSVNQNGLGLQNNAVFAYHRAAEIITDTIASNINLLAVPGQREPLVTNYIGDRVRDYGNALYLQDIQMYNTDIDRVFDNEKGQYVDVENTADVFESRAIDNFNVASYFPNVTIEDEDSGKRVTVPATVAALAALGYNDKVAYPWFAPAGFNRASLDFVKQTQTRIRQAERERLFDVNVNPIVKFPNEGYVIFSQNTNQQEQTALSSINVQRMVSDVKRQVITIGNKVIWDNIVPEIQVNLRKDISAVLSVVQTRKGIERFRVICDNTNNTADDRNNNRVNVKVLFKPTRAIEFISLDFIITRSGVEFV